MTVTEEVEYDGSGNGRFSLTVKTSEGEEKVRFANGEPDDMTLGRDLSDAFTIKTLVKMAYEAGKRGEPFELIEEQIGSEDDDE